MPAKRTLATMTALLIIAAALAFSPAGSPPAQSEFDWRSDWAVQLGFNIQVDAEGFRFPTAIAFVPKPGQGPKDPLYFVTELRGAVKVVTNDRSVFTFAQDFFRLQPRHELPSGSGEMGLAGLCLAPSQGYVFVTFAYQDENSVLRNNVVRFQAPPNIFSVTPSAQMEFTELFAPFRSVVSHQIGPCQVQNGLLFVNVGDGSQPDQSQQVESLLGKVLRMTLDGKPVPSNPFFQDDGVESAEDFVWAHGLRNPFGLVAVGDELFATDNGPTIDRFIRVTQGSNYLWSKGNLGIGSNADLVISPGEGVAQIDYYPSGTDLFPPQFRDSFYLTVSGSADQQIPGVPAILQTPYDLERSQVGRPPTNFLQYRGNGLQVLAALAFGPNGLYFAPLFADQTGNSAVLRITHEAGAAYPYTLGGEQNPTILMNSNGCFACHSLGSRTDGTIGPALNQEELVPRITARLDSPEYLAQISQLDDSEEEPFLSYREHRRRILQADGLEKVALWIEARIQEPRFDDPDAQMPKLNMPVEQAVIIAAFLTGAGETEESRGPIQKIRSFVGDRLPEPPRQKHLVYFFAVGLLIGGAVAALAYWVYIKLRNRRNQAIGP